MQILGLCPCFGAHADPLSYLLTDARPDTSSAPICHPGANLRRPITHPKRQIIPSSAASFSFNALSAQFKVHRLPWGRLPSSRCIRSAPRRDLLPAHCSVAGRSRYSTKTCRYKSRKATGNHRVGENLGPIRHKFRLSPNHLTILGEVRSRRSGFRLTGTLRLCPGSLAA